MLSRTTVLNMFGRSPVNPLQRHMEKAYACVAYLQPFLEAVIRGDWENAASISQEINVSERNADALKLDIRTHLPKHLFLTVSRADLLGLLSEQEGLANTARDIAGMILSRQLSIPEPIQLEIQQFLKICIRASQKAKETIEHLDELFDPVFRGKEAAFVHHLLSELNILESETDRLQVGLRYSIFQMEQGLSPTDIINFIFLYEVVKLMGALANHAQHAGNYLEMLMAA